MSNVPKNRLDFGEESPAYKKSLEINETKIVSGAGNEIGENVFPPLPDNLRTILGQSSTVNEVPSSSGHTFRVGPSSLLAKLDMFLPEMKRANEELAKNIARDGVDKYSIEKTSETGPKIQFGITVGVLEEKEGMDDETGDDQGILNEIKLKHSEAEEVDMDDRLDRMLFPDMNEGEDETEGCMSFPPDERDEDEIVTLSVPKTKNKDTNGVEETSITDAVATMRKLGFEPVHDVSIVPNDVNNETKEKIKPAPQVKKPSITIVDE